MIVHLSPLVIFIGLVFRKIPSLISETTNTTPNGNQISAGLSGVTPGMLDIIATAKK
jgi:hypothetical protein